MIQKQPTLIEYATFFGSIQIIKYLNINGVKFTPSLWFYAIHSMNPEAIEILNENNIIPTSSFCKCLDESIKCHHNEIAQYIKENFIDKEKCLDNNLINEQSLRYYNYHFFPDKIDVAASFFNLCKYHHLTLVNLHLKMKEKDILEQILKINNFLMIMFETFILLMTFENIILMKFHILLFLFKFINEFFPQK